MCVKELEKKMCFIASGALKRCCQLGIETPVMFCFFFCFFYFTKEYQQKKKKEVKKLY